MEPSPSWPFFSIDAKNYFLTYPRCPLSKEDVLSQLKSFNYPVSYLYIRVCQEQHSDGAHLHCLIQFSGKYRCRNNRFFDIKNSSTDDEYHPNIQSARSTEDVFRYIAKEGDFIEDGVFRPDGRKRKRNSAHVDSLYSGALKASTKEEALNFIIENYPKRLVLQYRTISAKLDKFFAPANEGYSSRFDPQSFVIPEELLLWARENVGPTRPDRPKSLILEGPTRIGKTEWARSLGPHNYNNGCCMDFSTFSNDVWYNVIDNLAPSYLIKKHWEQLLGAKKDWQANVKYGKPVQIKGGIPSIVLCNPDSSYKAFLEKEKNRALKDWTIVNVEFFFVDAPLYRSPASSQEAEEESNNSWIAGFMDSKMGELLTRDV